MIVGCMRWRLLCPQAGCDVPDLCHHPHVPLCLAGSWLQSRNRPSSLSCFPPEESRYPGSSLSFRHSTAQQSVHLSLHYVSFSSCGVRRWWGPKGAGPPAMAAYTVCSGASQVPARMVLPLPFLLSPLWRPQGRGETEAPGQYPEGQPGMGKFPPLSASTHTRAE